MRSSDQTQDSGVNLIWNLGVVDPGQRNFDFPSKLSTNFDFPGKNRPFTATSGQIILFLFTSHHFRTLSCTW